MRGYSSRVAFGLVLGVWMLGGCLGELQTTGGSGGAGGSGGGGGAGGGGADACLVEWCHTDRLEANCGAVVCPAISSSRIEAADIQETHALGVVDVPGSERLLLAGRFRSNVLIGEDMLASDGGVGQEDAFLASFDPQLVAKGAVAVGQASGGASPIGYVPRVARGVAYGATGSVIVGGRYRWNEPGMSEENLDAFVRAFSPDLQSVRWTATFGGQGTDEVVGVAATTQWAYVLASLGSVDFTAEVTIACGMMTSSDLIGPAQQQMVLVQYDSTGNCSVLLRTRGGFHAPVAITEEADDLYIAGTYTGAFEGSGMTVPTINEGTAMFLMKVGSSGNVAWVKTFHGPESNVRPTAIAVSGGDVFVTGALTGSIDFGDGVHEADQRSPFLLALDIGGNTPRSVVLPGASASGLGVAATPDGGALVSGTFFVSLDFDPANPGAEVEDAGSMSAFLAKFDGNARLQTFDLIGGGEPPVDHWLPLAPLGTRVFLAGGWSTKLRFEDASTTPTGLDILLARVQP